MIPGRGQARGNIYATSMLRARQRSKQDGNKERTDIDKFSLCPTTNPATWFRARSRARRK